MNKYIACSLIAIAPLMLRAEVEEAAPLESLFESENEPLLSVEQEVREPLAQEEIVAEELSYKQSDSPPNVSSSSKEWECTPDIQPYQVSVGHIEGKGVGYNTGYTTLEAFFAPSWGKYIPFFDVKGHVFDDGKFATNLGVGLRYAWKPEKYLFGASWFYDYRNTKHGHYNQMGAGFEVYADRYEFRANGYFPIGNKHFGYDKELTGISFKKFEGNNILFNEYYDGKVEFAMKGFNAEIGVHPLDLPVPYYDLYVSAGTYYYVGHYGKNTWGGKFRVTGKVYKYFSVELSDSFDRVFHNRFQGQVAFTYPLGNKKLRAQKKTDTTTCFNDNIMYWRASQPVQRQDAIVVNHKNHHKSMVDPIAINPSTGQPYFVVFVNNTNPSTGNGTFEDPYQALTTAETNSDPGDTLYVFAGDGTPTNMSNGITLQSDQRLLGSGHAHTYQTTRGTLVVPAQTAGIPYISYQPGNHGVILADGSEVSGFHVEVNSSTLTSNNRACIFAGSNALTRGSTITNNVLLNDTFGISIGLEDNPVQGNFAILNNNCSLHAGTMGQQGFGIRANIANGYTLIENNVCNDNLTLANSSDGMFIRPHNSPEPMRCDIVNNQVNSNSGSGIRISLDGNAAAAGSVCVNVIGNTMSYNEVLGFQSISAMTNSIPHIVIENNVSLLSSPPAGNGGMEVGTNGMGTALCARFNNNTATITDASQALMNTSDFLFDSATGTLHLEPPADNEGTARYTDPAGISPVFPGDCGCP